MGKSFQYLMPEIALDMVKVLNMEVTSASQKDYFTGAPALSDVSTAQVEDSQREIILTLANGDFITFEAPREDRNQ